jgi:hypothetical protein
LQETCIVETDTGSVTTNGFLAVLVAKANDAIRELLRQRPVVRGDHDRPVALRGDPGQQPDGH